MKREIPSRFFGALLAASLLVSTAPATAATARPTANAVASAATMGRVPADRAAQIQAMLPTLPGPAADKLRAALNEFDKHSTFWQSLKWAADSGGAVLGPIFASVGIAAAGKLLGDTALAAMAWGGPAIWGIGAVAGLGGAVGIVAYEHNKHWYPKALAALDQAIATAQAAAGTPVAAANPAPAAGASTTAAGPGSPQGPGLALLGVGQQH